MPSRDITITYQIVRANSSLNDLTGISHISGLTLSLNASAYSVAENGGSVNVCVLGLRGTRSSSATATISTQDISAIGLFNVSL